MALEDPLRPGTQAASDNDFAVFLNGLANRIERLVHRGIDEATCVYNNYVRGVVGGGYLVTFGAQVSKDPLGINQCLGTPEADETDAGGTLATSRRGCGRGAGGGGA